MRRYLLCACLIAASSAMASPEHLDAGGVVPAGVPFSAAVRANGVIYLSGQMGTVPGTKTLVDGGVEPQARQAIANIRAILEAQGRSLQDLLRCTVMLADINDWAAFNRIWVADVPAPWPARSAFAASGLALGGRVEVECTASAN